MESVAKAAGGGGKKVKGDVLGAGRVLYDREDVGEGAAELGGSECHCDVDRGCGGAGWAVAKGRGRAKLRDLVEVVAIAAGGQGDGCCF